MTVNVQLEPAATEPPDNASVPGLVAVELAVAVPPQPVLVTVVLVLTSPVGYVSVNATAVMAAPVTLVKVIVIVVPVLAATVLDPKVLVACGLAICNVAAAAAVFAPPLVDSAPTAIVLP